MNIEVIQEKKKELEIKYVDSKNVLKVISQILDILNYLDETEREVVVMHVLGDMKHREIADILKKPIGTITWIYNKAINKAQEKFRE